MSRPVRSKRKLAFGALILPFVLFMLCFIPLIRNTVFPFWVNGVWKEISTTEILRMRSSALSRKLPVLKEICPKMRSPGIIPNAVDRTKIHDYPHLNTPQFRKKVAQNGHAMYLNVLSLEQKHNLLYTYVVFAAQMRFKNISFFVNGGTHLGAFRHGGFIPWDDDIDIGVNITDLETIHGLLTCLEGFKFRQHRRTHWFFHTSPHMGVHMDLFFYETNEKYVWCNTMMVVDDFIYKREDVFPLGRALFEGIWMPVPGRLKESIKREFNPHMCYCKRNKRHRHNTSWARQYSAGAYVKVSVECKELAYMYEMNLDI